MDVTRLGAEPLTPQQVCVGTPVALASDNAGYELKAAVIDFLEASGVPYIDCNPEEGQANHYPQSAHQAAQHIMQGRAKSGILICGTGIGIGIAAMKCPGIYPVRCDSVEQAILARRQLDVNMLTFGQRVTGFGLALDMVRAFLSTPFDQTSPAAAQIREAERQFVKEAVKA